MHSFSHKSLKLTALLLMLSLMLTSCALLPTSITDSITAPEDDTVTISREEYEKLKQYEELDELQRIVDQLYYQEPDHEKMMSGAKKGFLFGLEDPYTFYYTPEEFAAMKDDDKGEYAGVGLQIMANYVTGLCTISRVFADSPALEAGILRGDVMIGVEDLDVTASTLQEAVDIMRGKIGEPVKIKVQRGDQILDFTVNRAKIHVNWVSSTMLPDNIGYITLYEFSGDCSVAFEKHLHELIDQGAKALILDLRDNPGGWVNDAEKIADKFMDKGEVASLLYRDGSTEYYKTTTDGKELDIPLVVLVNEFSASSSELLSGALQDRDRATIVGVQTYGKGIVQYVLPVGQDGAGMQLTVAQYFTPNDHPVHKIGITPDVVVEMPEEYQNTMFDLGDLTDPQLKQAYDEALKLIK